MPGDAVGGVPDRPYTRPGGVATRVNAFLVGVRDTINYEDTPGVTPFAQDDTINAKVNVQFRVNGEVRLGPRVTGLNLLTTSLATLLSSPLYQQAQVTRVLVIAENVDTVTTQPDVEVGTDAPGNPPNNDVAASQALTLTATGQVQELTLVTPNRPVLTQTPPVDVLRLRRTNVPGANAYLIGVQVFGTVLVP